MSSPLACGLLLLASYLVGAIPFGYVIGRFRGVNLFKAGSGNIGATNAARVLGPRYGTAVFLLDFLKGAIPCAAIVSLAHILSPAADIPANLLRVGAAAGAFLGHLFPIYLGFQGGKGVATGAGTVFVLVPGPAALAILTWVAVLLASRAVSLASLAAVGALIAAYLLSADAPFGSETLPITLYLLAATALVVVKHRGNIARLIAGSESRIGDFTMRQTLLRGLHILALGFWFGGAGFFNFLAAPPIFASFKEVVDAGPSDRTAYMTIISKDAPSKEVSADDKKALASALAGSAVGPVFPRYFAMQAVCGVLALIPALSWRSAGPVHRWRVTLLAAALLMVAIGWPISNHVSDLRVMRFRPDRSVDASVQADFVAWHLLSLLLSFVTVVLAGVALALAASLPSNVPAAAKQEKEEQKVLV